MRWRHRQCGWRRARGRACPIPPGTKASTQLVSGPLHLAVIVYSRPAGVRSRLPSGPSHSRRKHGAKPKAMADAPARRPAAAPPGGDLWSLQPRPPPRAGAAGRRRARRPERSAPASAGTRAGRSKRGPVGGLGETARKEAVAGGRESSSQAQTHLPAGSTTIGARKGPPAAEAACGWAGAAPKCTGEPRGFALGSPRPVLSRMTKGFPGLRTRPWRGPMQRVGGFGKGGEVFLLCPQTQHGQYPGSVGPTEASSESVWGSLCNPQGFQTSTTPQRGQGEQATACEDSGSVGAGWGRLFSHLPGSQGKTLKHSRTLGVSARVQAYSENSGGS